MNTSDIIIINTKLHVYKGNNVYSHKSKYLN